MCAVLRVSDVIAVLEELAPSRLAESWDNVGLLVGDPDDAVERVLFTIDYTQAVAEEAASEGVRAKLVVAYHPPIFEPMKRLSSTNLAVQAARNGVALYSPHTALDVADGGTNDMLGDVVGMIERAPLRVRSDRGGSNLGSDSGAADGALVGIGRIGRLAEATTRALLVARIKEGLGVAGALVAGPVDGLVQKVAVVAGAGGDLYKDALRQGADVYLTGEMRHHDAIACARAGMTVVCVLHSNSERKALQSYAWRLSARAPSLKVTISQADRDPFVFA